MLNNLNTNFNILLHIHKCKLLSPTAASVGACLVKNCILVVPLRTHAHIHSLTISWGLRVCPWDLPAISITVSPAKWGERHRQPTGRLLPFWGSGSRGPDCFAQGQHDSGIVIYILVDCILLFHVPPRKPEHAIAWPEFDINCTPPRRSSTSRLEFVPVKTKPWHSSSIQNKKKNHVCSGDGRMCTVLSSGPETEFTIVFWCILIFFFSSLLLGLAYFLSKNQLMHLHRFCRSVFVKQKLPSLDTCAQSCDTAVGQRNH